MSVTETIQTTNITNNLQQLPIDSHLTKTDRLILDHLLDESYANAVQKGVSQFDAREPDDKSRRENVIKILGGLNDPQSQYFEPTVFLSRDLKDFPKGTLARRLLDVYVRFVSGVARHPTDIVFVTHLILYFTTTVPSAIYLFYRFTWIHSILHTTMTGYYFGTYTLMRHNHIHNNGILSGPFQLLDITFPYLLDPLMGHTWNSYYYHHVKHHHVEGNGPNDLSSTIRLQRDEWLALAYYVGRFTLLIWLELPSYFLRTGKPQLALRAAFWELWSYAFLIIAARFHLRATIFTLIIPFCLIRLGLMIGNFGQHAFVDELEPDSDYRSSITLIDVPSNRFCFNDGYHTAHHLNPRRHWRDQPVSFLKGKLDYEKGRALVFRNIDYLEITFRLMRKDYSHLAKCFVPISEEQRKMTHLEIAEMLRTKTKRFSEADIKRLWGSTDRKQ
ncbi:MAG: hypothetical protein Q9227_005697 [Pyrenula ochraceoflavens]